MIVFRSAVQPERKQSGRRTIVVRAQCQLPYGRVVNLQRCAILPVLAVERATQEDASAIAEHAFHAQGSAAILRCHWRVYRAAHVLRHGRVSVGAQSFSAGHHRPLPEAHGAPARAEWRTLISVRTFDRSIRLHRMTRLQIDHPKRTVPQPEPNGELSFPYEPSIEAFV